MIRSVGVIALPLQQQRQIESRIHVVGQNHESLAQALNRRSRSPLIIQ
jgi:hypothetical protein